MIDNSIAAWVTFGHWPWAKQVCRIGADRLTVCGVNLDAPAPALALPGIAITRLGDAADMIDMIDMGVAEKGMADLLHLDADGRERLSDPAAVWFFFRSIRPPVR